MSVSYMIGEWLIGAALRSLLVLIVVAVLVLLFRKSSAATLYRFWLLGLVSCLVLPLLSSALPRWKLEVLPTNIAVQPVSNSIANPQEIVGGSAEVDIEELIYGDPGESKTRFFETYPKLREITIPDVDQSPSNSNPVAVDNEQVASVVSLSPSGFVVVIWLLGVAVVWVRYVRHSRLASELRFKCRSCDDESWLLLLAACSQQLRIRRPVSLAFQASEISPMVVGILRPTILLPESAKLWDAQRCRLVLLHELAHVQRNDLLSQLLAITACAIYWFNPLAWYANRQLKKLREIACDDAVIRQTGAAELYAETLLSIAVAHRQRSLLGAIAMARTNNVKDRIGCILDSARRRNPLTGRFAALLAMLACGLSVIVGTGSLTSRAQDTQPKDANAAEIETQKEETRPFREIVEDSLDDVNASDQTPATKTMTIRILDEDDNPLAGAELKLRVLRFSMIEQSKPKLDLITDEKGEVSATFRYPGPSQLLKLVASKAGYASMFAELEQWSAESDWLPANYEIRLSKNSSLSGRIVDQSGKGIAGAKIQVDVDDRDMSFEPDEKQSFLPIAEGGNAAISDSDGVWKIDNAPNAKAYSGAFKLKVNHPDYAGDKEWGDLQREQGVTTEQLRAGKGVIRLRKGVRLTGVVTDAEGKPITKGMVAWTPSSELPWEPFGQDKTQAMRLNADGRYETQLLKPGRYRIAASSGGYAPQQYEIDLDTDMQELNFSLQTGKTIKLRVVDSAGKIVPNATVEVGPWRGFYCLYDSEIPPNALIDGDRNSYRTSIVLKADKEGVFEWKSAPDDKVKYFAGAEGSDYSSHLLVAGPDVQEIRLNRKPVLFGKVTDKATGKPIQSFNTSAVQQQATSNSYSFEPDYVQSNEGEYRFGPRFNWPKGKPFRVQIKAEGYRTAIGNLVAGVTDEPVQENFALERASSTPLSVQDADGRPVYKYLITQYSSSGGVSHQIDKKGESHTLAANTERTLIRVSADQGYAEVLLEPDEQVSTIHLQPWAAVHGRLTQGGIPVADQSVLFRRASQSDPVKMNYWDMPKATTDKNGYFRIEKLPPVPGRVCVEFDPTSESKVDSCPSTPVNLQPGVTTELELGASGVTLSGRVIASNRKKDSAVNQWSVNYLIRRDGNADTAADRSAKIHFNGPMNLNWVKGTGFLQWVLYTAPTELQHWIFRRTHYVFGLDKKDAFKVHGVEQGEYDLLIQLYDKPSVGLVETVGQKIVPLRITADQATSGSIDIGSIVIDCHQGPRVGADMQNFQFSDASGTARDLSVSADRYTLVHVWSAEDELCMEDLTSMGPLVEQYAADPIDFVSFNIDSDVAQAQAITEKMKNHWEQNFLGGGSDLTKKLAITTLPAYYLVGRDGKLVASSELWFAVQEMLKKQFEH